MTPRVTVLMAVHNGEPYLRRAIESVLAQTLADFEFLIVDDASTDGTGATIESFDDPRIRLLRNGRNLGQVPSLNRGLREARGEYIARMDADDVSRPARLERQVEMLEREPQVGLVGSWMTLVDEQGRTVGELRAKIEDYARFVYQTLIMRVYVSHPAAAYRREPVLALGGYDESTGPAEDKDLWRKLCLERWDARIVQEPLVEYRLHEAQLSQTRAAYQQEVDARSQERFLSELAPGTAAPVRMLLADDPALWQVPLDAGATAAGVGKVLAGARERLTLDGAEAQRVQELVGARLLTVAAGRPWTPRARAFTRCGIALLPAEARRSAVVAVFPRAAVAPVRIVAAATARRASAAAPRMRNAVGRWHLARRLYAKLVGGG